MGIGGAGSTVADRDTQKLVRRSEVRQNSLLVTERLSWDQVDSARNDLVEGRHRMPGADVARVDVGVGELFGSQAPVHVAEQAIALHTGRIELYLQA